VSDGQFYLMLGGIFFLIYVIGIIDRALPIRRWNGREVNRSTPCGSGPYRSPGEVRRFLEACCPYCYLRYSLAWPYANEKVKRCLTCGAILYHWNETMQEHFSSRKV